MIYIKQTKVLNSRLFRFLSLSYINLVLIAYYLLFRIKCIKYQLNYILHFSRSFYSILTSSISRSVSSLDIHSRISSSFFKSPGNISGTRNSKKTSDGIWVNPYLHFYNKKLPWKHPKSVVNLIQICDFVMLKIFWAILIVFFKYYHQKSNSYYYISFFES